MQPEFSRIVDLTLANESVVHHDFKALEEEMAALSKRFDVETLAHVDTQLTVSPHALGHHIKGQVSAALQQTCVVTGQPLNNTVEAEIDFLAISDGTDLDLESIEEAYRVEEADTVDPSSFDVGELAAQYLSLAIDPFPRAPGAQLDTALAGDRRDNPFSVLAQLKNKP